MHSGESPSYASGITVLSLRDNCMRAKKQYTNVSQDVYSLMQLQKLRPADIGECSLLKYRRPYYSSRAISEHDKMEMERIESGINRERDVYR